MNGRRECVGSARKQTLYLSLMMMSGGPPPQRAPFLLPDVVEAFAVKPLRDLSMLPLTAGVSPLSRTPHLRLRAETVSSPSVVRMRPAQEVIAAPAFSLFAAWACRSGGAAAVRIARGGGGDGGGGGGDGRFRHRLEPSVHRRVAHERACGGGHLLPHSQVRGWCSPRSRAGVQTGRSGAAATRGHADTGCLWCRARPA